MSDALLVLRAAACWLASAVTVSTALLLRADSDGPAPGWPAILATMTLLALAFWPMTASRRRLPAFALSLIALQVFGHALLLYATTGQATHSGAAGLFCCPSTPAAGQTGLIPTLTANAGWLLLLVQLLVVALLAVPLQLLHSAFLTLAQALSAVLTAAAPALSGLLRLLAFSGLPDLEPPTAQRAQPGRVLGSGRRETGAVRRRGPPATALVRSSIPLAPRGACA